MTPPRIAAVLGALVLLAAAVKLSDPLNGIAATAACIAGALAVRRFGLVALMSLPLVFGPFWLGDDLPSEGDEPAYLAVSESLVLDGDLAVDNQFGRPPFDTHVSHLGLNHDTGGPGRYSLHQPGVSVVVAGGWAVAERGGALLVMAAITALTLREAVLLAETFGVSRQLAVWAAGLLYLSPAVFLYGRVVFSEMLAALILVHLARVLRQAGQDDTRLLRRHLATASLAAAALPWVHLRYVVVGGVLVFVIALRGRWPGPLAPLVALGLSGVGVLWAFSAWFGLASPEAGYGPGNDLGAPTLRGVNGVLVDGHAGLLFTAPLAVLAMVGSGLVARIDRAWVLSVGVALAAYTAIAAGWSQWWLGTSAPGRNWTALVMLATPMLGAVLGRAGRFFTTAITAMALVVGALFLSSPGFSYPGGRGGTTLIWARLHVDRMMPTFQPNWGVSGLEDGVALILAVIVGILIGARALSGPPSGRSTTLSGGAASTSRVAHDPS